MTNSANTRVLRIVGTLIGALIVLLVLCLLSIWLLVNPNAYKGRIEQAVRQSTGRTLSLSGDIKLSVFPSIALELGPASLGNPPGFGAEPFAAVRHVSLQVRLLPLLRKQLQIGHVRIDGLDLRLKSNARHQGNWEFGASASSAPSPAASSAPGTAGLPQVSGIDITDSRVSYEDTVAEQVALTVGRVASGATVPVQLRLNLIRGAGAQPIALAGSFGLTVDSEAYRLAALKLRLDDTTLRGQASLSRAADQTIDFDLAIDNIDLDRYLKADPAATKAAPTAAAAPAPIEVPVDSLRKLQLQGSLTIDRMGLKGLKLSDVRIGVRSRDGLLHIAPETVTLYGGSASGDTTLDVRGSTPVLKLALNGTRVDVKPLLADLTHTQRLSGRGNLTMDLRARGGNSDALIRTLDGTIAANLTDGAVSGVDLWFEIQRAQALFQRQAPPTGGGQGQTKFDTFKTSATVAQGIATTKDLTIASQNLRVAGTGSTNLVNQAINYRLQVEVLKGAAAGAGGALLAVPVDVTGTLSNFKVRPDLAGLARSNLEQRLNKVQLPRQIPQQIPELLKGLLGPHH